MAINNGLLAGLVLCACFSAVGMALEATAFLASVRIRGGCGGSGGKSMTAACAQVVMLVFGACAGVTSIAIGAVWALDGGVINDSTHAAGAALIVVGNVTLGITIVRAMWGGRAGTGPQPATDVASVVVVEALPSVLPGRLEYSSRSASVTGSSSGSRRGSPKPGADGMPRRSSLRSTSPLRGVGGVGGGRRLSSPCAISASAARVLPPAEFV